MESLRPCLGLEVQFVLTTKNAEGEQCYEARDSVTVEIKNRQGKDCATEAQVQDNKDGSYKVSYFAKETGKCDVSVKVNEQHVHGSPFAIQVKARNFRPVLSFGQRGSAAGMLIACVAGGLRERASGRAAICPPWRSPRGNSRGNSRAGIQPDSSPILSRLRHSCSQLCYQNKCTALVRESPPATQAITVMISFV